MTDPVAAHLGGLPDWSRTITITQLIHHTSGIADHVPPLMAEGYGLADHTTQQQALAVIAKEPGPQPSRAGTFVYSNSNYVLLAGIVESVSG